MTKGVVTRSQEGTVAQVFSPLEEHGFGKLVVVKDGKSVGFLAQSDLIAAARKVVWWSSTKSRVRKWMTKNSERPRHERLPNGEEADGRARPGALPLTKGREYVDIFTEAGVLHHVLHQFCDAGGLLSIRSPAEILSQIKINIADHLTRISPIISSISADQTIFFTKSVMIRVMINSIMMEKKVRRLLVVDGAPGAEAVVCSITQTDSARALHRALRETADGQGVLQRTPCWPLCSFYSGASIGEHRKTERT